MRSRLVAVVLVIGLAVAGCSGSNPGQSAAVGRADELWSARAPYVGDSSRVVGLLRAAGFGPEGTYTTSLQTAQAPYGVTVALRSLGKPFKDVAFDQSATLALGLIANLDHVAVTFDGQVYEMTARRACDALGFDVKDLGRDKATLAAYLQAKDD